jgi:hypothetical protein
MSALANYQEQFFSGLVNQPSADLLAQIATHSDQASNEAALRMAVYQNNYAHSLREALKDSYPVVLRLIGEDFFHALAMEFIQSNPPQQASLQSYGLEFIKFISEHEQCQQLPFLTDIAHIEYLYIQCFHGPEQEAINLNHLLAEEENDLPNVVFTAHPNVHMISSDYPSLDIWYANLEDEVAEINLDECVPSRILIYRNDELQVETVQLNDMAYAFCHHLVMGQSISEAWDNLQDTSDQPLDDDDLNGMLTYFLGLGVFTGLSIKQD